MPSNEIAIVDELFDPILDEKNPQSVFSLSPFWFREVLLNLPEDLFELNEHELVTKIWKNGQPDPTSQLLKLNFWNEYEIAAQSQTVINFQKVIHQVCPLNFFRRKFIPNKDKLSWMLRVPCSYEAEVHDLHKLGIRTMRLVLSMSPLDAKGNVNNRLVDCQRKIFEHIDQRSQGGIIQRIQQNVNQRTTTVHEDSSATSQPVSMDEIEHRLAQLEHKSKMLQTPGKLEVQILPKTKEPDTLGSNDFSTESPAADAVDEEERKT